MLEECKTTSREKRFSTTKEMQRKIRDGEWKSKTRGRKDVERTRSYFFVGKLVEEAEEEVRP